MDKEDISSPEFKISWSIINRAREKIETVYLKNALEHPDFKKAKSVFLYNILSVICLPIVHHNKLIGVLYTDNCTIQGVFKLETCQLLQRFVGLIAGPLYAALKSKILENNIQELQNQIETRTKYFLMTNLPFQENMIRRSAEKVLELYVTCV